jgi:hypothetical protein
MRDFAARITGVIWASLTVCAGSLLSSGRKRSKDEEASYLLWPQRNATLSVGSLFRSAYLLYFSQPAAERLLYRATRGKPIRSIVELGIDLKRRTTRLLEVAAWRGQNLPLRYTGIDLFEARPSEQPKLSLKQAFAALKRPQVNVQLVPGDPAAALRRVANSLTGTDLVIIGADQDRLSLSASWIWLPRMLTPTSLIFIEEPSAAGTPCSWRRMTIPQVEQLAAQTSRSVRRAA